MALVNQVTKTHTHTHTTSSKFLWSVSKIVIFYNKLYHVFDCCRNSKIQQKVGVIIYMHHLSNELLPSSQSGQL